MSVSLVHVTELISDRDPSKRALLSKISSCSFVTDCYSKSLTIIAPAGI